MPLTTVSCRDSSEDVPGCLPKQWHTADQPYLVVFSLDFQVPGFLSRFDLIAGTSTGSVIALCLAKGMAASDILEAYQV